MRRRGGGRNLSQSPEYLLEHTLKVLVDIAIPNANDLEPVRSQSLVSGSVPKSVSKCRVLTSIDLHHYSWVVASKVDDEILDRHLTPKVKSLLSELP